MKDKITIYKLLRTIIVMILCTVGIVGIFFTKNEILPSVCLYLVIMVYTSFTNKIEDLYDEKLKETIK